MKKNNIEDKKLIKTYTHSKKDMFLKTIEIGRIDSMNICGEFLENYFDNDDCIIETVKSVGIFDKKRWIETYGKPLMRHIVEAKILHTSSGLTIPMKRHSVSPNKQTLELAGLHGYNDKSKLLSELLSDLYGHIQDERITRIDIAIDFKGKVPNEVIEKLFENKRIPFKWKNTIYNKTKKEKRSNSRLNIKIYNKAKKENLDYELERLELNFQGDYFKGFKVKNIDQAYLKMQKTIKRMTGLEVRILPIKVSL